MKEIDFKLYNRLLKEGVPLSQIPKSILNSTLFHNLVSARIVEKESIGKGSQYMVKNIPVYEEFFKTNFPDFGLLSNSKSNNVAKYRNSKATRIENEPIFFIRGFCKAVINGQEIDLNLFMRIFGLFAARNIQVSFPNICFVENLESFIKAEKIFGKDYLFLHKYGRIGKSSISGIKSKNIIVFSDYDFTGLNEFLIIKSVFSEADFYLPPNFDDVFEKYSRISPQKSKMSGKVSASKIPSVVLVREKVLKSNRFLEQEILYNL